MIEEFIKVLMENHSAQKDKLIKTAIGTNNDWVLFDLSQIAKRGQRNIFPDGREVFIWDGKPLIEFYPIETSFDGTKMTVTQKYRVYT